MNIKSGSVCEVIEITKKIKAVVLDNDGVLTDNTEIIGNSDGTVLKRRSHYDGQGISFLRAVGIRVAILTGDSRQGAVAIGQLVDKWNNLPSMRNGSWHPVHLVTGIMGNDKAVQMKQWLNDISIDAGCCAVMGDDYVDLEMLKSADLRAAPVSAEKDIIDFVHVVSHRNGGSGAVRDLANFILRVQGYDMSKLAFA